VAVHRVMATLAGCMSWSVLVSSGGAEGRFRTPFSSRVRRFVARA